MKLPRVGIWGATASAPASRSEPTSTTLSGMSRSVRILAAIDEPKPKSLTLSRNDDTIVGSVRTRVMIPAASTAPAPMYRMYALQICWALI